MKVIPKRGLHHFPDRAHLIALQDDIQAVRSVLKQHILQIDPVGL